MPISIKNAFLSNAIYQEEQTSKRNISFKANYNNALEKNPQVDTFDKKNKKSKKIIIILGILTAVVLSIFGIKKINAKSVKDLARKNGDLKNIFENVKISFGKNKTSKQDLTIKEILDKYMKDFDAGGRTYYHGTSIESAELIKKQGMKRGMVGGLTCNFSGSYLAEEEEVAREYARRAVSRGKTQYCDKATAGAVVSVKLPQNSKLAQFMYEDGTQVDDILYRIFDDNPALLEELKAKKLYDSDLIRYIQDYIKEKGYIGIRTKDAHTGMTDVIFDGKMVEVSNIINV